jgi:hypothetical protein
MPEGSHDIVVRVFYAVIIGDCVIVAFFLYLRGSVVTLANAGRKHTMLHRRRMLDRFFVMTVKSGCAEA